MTSKCYINDRLMIGYIPRSAYVRQHIYNLLMNYIPTFPGVPVRMHFTDDYYVDRQIADRETGKPKRVKTLVFWADSLGGEPCARTFSILSQKLEAIFLPYLKDKEYTKYEFIVTQMGDGFLKDWNVQMIKLPEK